MELNRPKWTRRALLRAGTATGALFTLARLPAVPLLAGSSRAVHAADEEPQKDSNLLVVIFLRGGADGLHLLAPLGDPHYRSLRQSLALSNGIPVKRVSGPLDEKDPGFQLHPAFAPLGPVLKRGELALIPMSGSPHPSRSHFEAQDLMETGLSDRGISPAGWMARALEVDGPSPGDPEPHPFELISLTETLPLGLRGADCFAIAEPREFGLPRAGASARRALLASYQQAAGDAVGQAGLRALEAMDELETRFGIRPQASRSRRRRARGLETCADQLARMLEANLPIRAVFMESDGWDSHRGQGAEEGGITGRIRELATTLAKLQALPRGRRARVVVMSEFGRTVRPNGSRGTDHGHGGTLLVCGPGIRGGVHGPWTGLHPDRLYEGRDLPTHTDYRNVLHPLLEAHLGAPPPANSFPGFVVSPLSLLA